MTTAAEVPDQAPNVLEIRGLRVEFRTRHGVVHAVNGVDLTLAAGQTHALVGESGSGKSVTALAICGLLPERQAAVSGEILLDGVNLVGLSERAMRRFRGRDVAMVFQDPSAALDPVRRVGGQVAESLTAQGISRPQARRRTLDLLSEVGLYSPAQLVRRYPFELSGGMKQRVVISAAMAPRPRVLIADEPTTALDATIQEQVLRLLHQMTVDHGTAMLLITHDLAVAARAAQRVSVMYGGTIVEVGATAVLLHRPRHPYTVGLLGAIPHLRADREPLRGVGGEPAAPGAEPAGCPFAPRCQWAISRCWTERPELTPADAGPDAAGDAHLAACWNPVRPAEVALGRPDRPEFTAAPPPDRRSAEPAGGGHGNSQERDR
jgi:oligopeptide/dipeptide ABC transporter ATP-binding protein